MKTCFKCGMGKDISEFYRHKAMADGFLGKCKECTRKDEKLRRILNPEKISAREKIRNAKRWDYMSKLSKKWREKNPEKYKAHIKLNNSLRDGKIKKPCACEICGLDRKLHAHHEDYSKPLEVIWLCARCHGQIQ